ncbi:MAG: hypothetical protein ACM3SR_00305 [Ignavibacteriales bacterium]
MKKSFIFIIATPAVTLVLFFSISLNAIAAHSPKTVIGEVTLVGENTLKIKEDTTQTEYELTVSPAKLKDLNTGDRIEVKATDGRVFSLTMLGMPMNAQPEPYQKWKIIEER